MQVIALWISLLYYKPKTNPKTALDKTNANPTINTPITAAAILLMASSVFLGSPPAVAYWNPENSIRTNNIIPINPRLHLTIADTKVNISPCSVTPVPVGIPKTGGTDS